MKKIKFAALSSLLLAAGVLALVSCGGGENPTTTTQPGTTTTQPGTTTTTQPGTTTTTQPGTTTTTTQPGTTTTAPAGAGVIYVVPNNQTTAQGKGTKDDPAMFSVAKTIAKPGDTILLKAGVYKFGSRQQLEVSGENGKYITIRPETNDARVIFDFSEMLFEGSNRGIQIYGDYWHIYNIEITGAGDNGMYVAGSHNIIEQCKFYNNRDTGLQIGRGYSENTHLDEWPAYNLILNCTSYANYDGETLGENADGFAAKLTIGYGNVFDGCMAYRNSDDGWDLFAKVDSGNIGTVYLYNCVSFENGYLPYTIDAIDAAGHTYPTYNTPNGDGIGFKLGGSTMEGDVVLNNCMAFDNKLHGYGDNSNPGVISINNCTAYNNCMGLNDDGTVSDTRGIKDEGANKSNNIDLARSTASYNNYYGVLSYINNQAKYSTEKDNSYNEDGFRGSVGYSLFTTGYDKGEIVKAFTGFEDASSWHSETTDVPFSGGTKYTKLNDACFASLASVNAICSSVDDLDEIGKYHTLFRNADGSVNMGDHLKVVSQELLTFANGNPIGANLSKNSYADYPHTNFKTFLQDSANNLTETEVDLISAYEFAEPITKLEATFQDFDIPRLISGCDITWTSSNEEVLHVDNNEVSSVSHSVFSRVNVIVPDKDTKVTLTATISKGSQYVTKDFEITVKSRHQALGELSSTSPKAIRVDLYGVYNAPRIYALDASANGETELPLSSYELETTYRFATDAKSTFYEIDGVYTSVPGVYEVTVVATSNIDNRTSKFVYNVYVVDPDCDIDFMEAEQAVSLTKNGFTITGNLSNIEGSVAAIVSDAAITGLTAASFVESDTNNNAVQYYPVSTDWVSAEFMADNMNVKDAEVQYYVYYVVLNKNQNNLTNSVRSFTITTSKVNDEQEFYDLARGITTSSSTVIYSLQKDLDFASFDWVVTDKDKSKAFSGLLNGNGHTISNITIVDENGENTTTANEKCYNVFYKVSDGGLLNVNFNEIILRNPKGKIMGVIGDLQGGYLYKVKLTNIAVEGKESIGALVGQITGKDNFIDEVSFVNPLPDEEAHITDHSKTVANDYIPTKYRLTSSNKYVGGIVGNVQLNSDQTYVSVNAINCYVKANLGDGNDAQGNTGGIIGRVKNETVNYTTNVEHCVFYGTIISKGQYQGGIIGDFDNGSGYVHVEGCVAGARFVWSSTVLDAYVARLAGADQKYAHKNSNPMIGRAVKGELGIYDTKSNYGTWTEYYESSGVISGSFAFNLSNEDEETGEIALFYPYEQWWRNVGFSSDIWEFDATTNYIYLK